MTSPDLNTTAEQEASDTASLKSRRRATTKKRSVLSSAAPLGEEQPPPLPDRHENMGAALTRRSMTLLHPSEKHQPFVAETGGYVPSSRMKDYVVAEFDASEQLTPPGCRTPITRTLWSVGQHVRRDVYATYLDEHPELLPATVVNLPEPGDDSEIDGEDEQGNGEAPPDTDQTV